MSFICMRLNFFFFNIYGFIRISPGFEKIQSKVQNEPVVTTVTKLLALLELAGFLISC